MEALVESIAGGIPGLGAGKIAAVAEEVLSSPAAVRALNVLGEGAEEVVSTVLSPYLERAIYNEGAENATAGELLQTALFGAALGGVFQGIDAASGYLFNGSGKNAPNVGAEAPLASELNTGENETASGVEAGLPKITMADFTDVNSQVWTNVAYEDAETQRAIQQKAHQEMVDAGDVVQIPEKTIKLVGESYPDLRQMKKKDRIPILRQKIEELKGSLRQFFGEMKAGSYEFEVNGNILEAKLYDTGVGEVMEKITQDKASMLYHSKDVFHNARYLYSTPDYDGDPNIYRWNYFYTPVQIGAETVGVRIAVRDVANPRESQIYNWGIKKNASLGGEGRGQNRIPPDASSDAFAGANSGTQAPNANGPGTTPSASLASSISANATVPHSPSEVNPQTAVEDNFIEPPMFEKKELEEPPMFKRVEPLGTAEPGADAARDAFVELPDLRAEDAAAAQAEAAGGKNRLYHFTPETIEVAKKDDGSASTDTLHERIISKTEVQPSPADTVPQPAGKVNGQSQRDALMEQIVAKGRENQLAKSRAEAPDPLMQQVLANGKGKGTAQGQAPAQMNVSGAERVTAQPAETPAKIASEGGLEGAAQTDYSNAAPGLVQNEFSAQLRQSDAKILDLLGKATGTPIVVQAQVRGGTANGSYQNGVALIAADAENPFVAVGKHEITHRMQELAPKEYQAYRDYAVQALSAEKSGLVEEYQRNAAAQGEQLTHEQALDEIAADFTELLLTDETRLEQFLTEATTQTDTRNMAQKFFDAVREFLSKVRSVFSGERARMDAAAREQFGVSLRQLEKAEQRWMELVRVSVGAEKNTAGSGGEVKYQAKNSKKDPNVLDPKTVTREDVVEMLKMARANEYSGNTYIPVRVSTPGIVQERLFAENLPIIMPVSKLVQAFSKDNGPVKGKNVRGHEFTVDEMVDIIERMDSPDFVYSQADGRGIEVIKLGEGLDSTAVVVEFGNNVNPAYMNGYEGGAYNVSVTTFDVDGGDVGLFMYGREKGWQEVFNKQKEGDPAKKFPATRPFAIEQDSLYEDTLNSTSSNYKIAHDGDGVNSLKGQSELMRQAAKHKADIDSIVRQLTEEQHRSQEAAIEQMAAELRGVRKEEIDPFLLGFNDAPGENGVEASIESAYATDDPFLAGFEENFDYFADEKRDSAHNSLRKINIQRFAISKEANSKKVAAFKENLENGNINLRVRWHKQNEHIEGTKQREVRTNRERETGKVSTYFYKGTDVETLINGVFGTGDIRFDSEKSIFPVEFISLEKPVGKAYNFGKKEWIDVSRIAIQYGAEGVHAYPVKDW